MSWRDAVEIGLALGSMVLLFGVGGLFRKHREFCCPRCLAPGAVTRHENGVTWLWCRACEMEWTVE